MPKATAMDTGDTRLADLCRRIIALEDEQLALCDWDEWAPDEGPYHERYTALGLEQNAAVRELIELGPPTTPEGIRALAQLAMQHVVRSYSGEIRAPESLRDWLLLVVATATLGQAEAVPVPEITLWPSISGEAAS